jgi:hypothetical protein
MAKEKWYVQARLQRAVPGTDIVKHMVSWIPEDIALPGKFIRLKKDDGTWTKPWFVMNRGKQRLSQKKVSSLAHGSKKFKENTDI